MGKICYLLILFLVLNSMVVVAAYYRIDTDGDPTVSEWEGNLANNLEWQWWFRTYGGENSGGAEPTLTVGGGAYGGGSVSIDDLICWPNPDFHAGWYQVGSVRISGNDRYTTYEHDPSDKFTYGRLAVNDGGTYTITMVSYGDGLDPDSPETGVLPTPCDLGAPHSCYTGASCPVPITNPICSGGGNDYYFENQAAECNSRILGATGYAAIGCPSCTDNPWQCGQQTYQCNGVWANVSFYDGSSGTPFWSVNSNGWGSIQFSRGYWGDSTIYTYQTDTTPATVSISRTFIICKDECSPGTTGCNSPTQDWICEVQADGCYDIVAHDCGTCGRCTGGGPCSTFCSDCGLRVRHSATETVAIACELEPSSWELKIRGSDGNSYGLVVVDTTDPDASNVRVQTSAGTKALRKYP